MTSITAKERVTVDLYLQIGTIELSHFHISKCHVGTLKVRSIHSSIKEGGAD